MKSIALNMNYQKNLNAAKSRDRSKLNLVSNLATIVPITKNLLDFLDHETISPTTIAEYPVSNLLIPSITKETKTTMVAAFGGGSKMGGLSITLPTTSVLFADQGSFNTVYVNINKMNKSYVSNFNYTTPTNELANNVYKYSIAFKQKSSPTNYKIFTFYPATNYLEVKNQSGTLLLDMYNYELCNIVEGNILIDQSLILKVFGVTSLSCNDYIIDIIVSGVSTLAAIDFSISNVFIGNAIDFYVSADYTFIRKNLSKNDSSPRAGKTFLEKNESLKTASSKFEFLTSEETVSVSSDFFIENKDYPIAFFPYAGLAEEITYFDGLGPLPQDEIRQHAKLNLVEGGLYFISKELALVNSTHDVFSFDIELTEYK